VAEKQTDTYFTDLVKTIQREKVADRLENRDATGVDFSDPQSFIPMSAVRPGKTQRVNDTRGDKFRSAVAAGAEGMGANLSFMDAAFQALTGDEQEMEEALVNARRQQQNAAYYLEGTEEFSEFLNEPTVDGFLDQTTLAVGQFLPSVVASIGAAAVGATLAPLIGVGGTTAAVTAAGSGAILRGASVEAAKKIMKRAWSRKANKLASKQADYDDLVKGSYPLMQKLLGRPGVSRQTRVGAVTGAGLQEGTQGTGITFGEFADQDMTGAREAAISFGVGVPYAALGLTGEAAAGYAVLAPLARIAKQQLKTAPKSQKAGLRSLISDIAKATPKEVAKGFGIGAIGEGITEVAQEGITITQRSYIDPEYSRQDAKMDAMEAAFMGFMGGGVLGGAGRGVTGTARELIQNARERAAAVEDNTKPSVDETSEETNPSDLEKINGALLNQEQKKQERKVAGTPLETGTQMELDLGSEQAYPELDNPPGSPRQKLSQMLEDGETAPEPTSNIVAQIKSMLNGKHKRNAVWIEEGHPVPTKQQLASIFNYDESKLFKGEVEGKGTIIALNSSIVNDVMDSNADDSSLARALQMTEPKNATHDRVVPAYDQEGNRIHAETTNEANQATVIANVQAMYPDARVDGAYDPQEIIQETNEQVLEEGPVQVQQAIEEIAEADSDPVSIAKALNRHWTNYEVLRQVHKSLIGKNDPGSVEAKEALELRLNALLREAAQKIIREEGITDPQLAVLKGLKNIQDEAKILNENQEEGESSFLERTSEEMGSQFEAQENQGVVFGTRTTMEDEAESFQLGKPEFDTDAQKETLNTVKKELLDLMTNNERTDFLAEQNRLQEINRGFPIGILKKALALRKAEPTSVINFVYQYKKDGKVARFNPTRVVTKLPAFAALLNINLDTDFGMVIEARRSPGTATVEGRSVEQYFQRMLVKANESSEEFRKSGFFVKKPDEEKLTPVDLVSLVWQGKKIVTAEQDYVEGDLQQSLRSFQAVLSVADELGYEFHMKNVDGKVVNFKDVTEGQIRQSQIPFYKKGQSSMTLGEYMSSKILMGDTSINGMTNHSANLVEAIVGEGNFTLEQLQVEVENKINETIVVQEDKQALVPPDPDPLEPPGMFPDVSVLERNFENFSQPKLKLRREIQTRQSKEKLGLGRQERSIGFLKILSALYDIAGEDGLDVVGLQSSFIGATSTREVDPSFEPGEPENVIHRMDGATQEGTKEQHVTSKEKDNLGIERDKVTSFSSDFNKSLGSLARPLTNTLSALNYFGLKGFGKKIVFLTHSDIITGDAERNKNILPNITSHQQYFQQYKEGLLNAKLQNKTQRGVHYTVGNTHVIIVDPSSLIKARVGVELANQTSPDSSNAKARELLAVETFNMLATVAHELGHTVQLAFIDGLSDPKKKGIRRKLLAEFEKAKNKVGAPSQYQDPNTGFEEWIADNVGTFLINYAINGKLAKADSVVSSWFRSIAKGLINIWNSIMERAPIAKRINIKQPNQVFEGWARDVLKHSVTTTKFRREQQGKLTVEQSDVLEQMLEDAAGSYNLSKENFRRLTSRTSKFATEIFEANPKAKLMLTKFFYSAQGFVESLGPTGKLISDFFYAKSQKDTGQGLAWIAARDKNTSKFLNDLADVMGLDRLKFFTGSLSKEQEKALLDADNDTISDQELRTNNPQAYQVRMFLRGFYNDYILPGLGEASKLKGEKDVLFDIKFLETELQTPEGKVIASYFPRTLKIYEFKNNDELRSRFEGLIEDKLVAGQLLVTVKNQKTGKFEEKVARPNPGQEPSEWAKEYVTKLFNLDPDESATEAVSKLHDDTNKDTVVLGMPSSLARTLRVQIKDGKQYGISNKELRDIGMLEPPQTALMNYIRQTVKRVELEKRGGSKVLEDLISKLPSEKKAAARSAIRAMLGKVDGPMDPWMRRLNSWGLFANVATTLTFAVFASFPDLAGPMLRSKDFGSFREGYKELFGSKGYFTSAENKQDAIQFAMDLGIISQETLSVMYIHASEMDYMSPGTKKATDAFFKVIMLDQFTKFTRIFAAGMGKRFIQNLAHTKEKDPAVVKRWLAELGLTKEEVLAWEAAGEDMGTPAGVKVSDAIYKFVDESIIRPNAAQRPVWASNPYLALVWQLKGFFYAYGKTIIGGQSREMVNRFNEAGVTAATMPLAMMGLTILPLTMVGLEFREYLKVLMGGVLPGIDKTAEDYLKTDNMDLGEYSFQIFDRSGVTGPWGLLLPLFFGPNYGGPFEKGAGLVGPSADKLYDFFKYGPTDSRFWEEQIPFYSTVN
tara:strand:- start:4453 stop:11301 length:6849 start_codon:yes stop_codon:yes gene_type:complete